MTNEAIKSPPPPSARLHEPRPLRSMRAFAWDLADMGVEEAIEQLRESGVDGLHLALAYHGGRFYCPHNPRRALVQAPDGVIYFSPDPDQYGALRPRLHPEYGSGAFAAEVREACTEYQMAFVAWAVLLNNASLGEWHPEALCVNALGDRIAGALCPANPEVRAYARGLVSDLALNVEADVIELEDFAYPLLEHYAGAEWRGIEPGPGLRFLLGLCFCPDCQRRAQEMGIESTDLKRRIERMIRQALAGDISERRLQDELSDTSHPITRYGTMRAVTITTLLDELLEAVSGSGTVLQPMLTDDPGLAWRSGVEINKLRQRVHRATVVAPAADLATVQHFMERYEALLDMDHDAAADLRLMSLNRHIQRDAAPDAAALLQLAQRAGYERLVLSHFGLASLEELDWLSSTAAQRQ